AHGRDRHRPRARRDVSAVLRDGALLTTHRDVLLRRVEEAIRRARRAGGPVLAAHTVRVGPDVDPAGTVLASRRPGERWFCCEQPSRDASAVAALGYAAELREDGSGGDRFRAVAGRWRELAGSAVGAATDGPAGSGLVAVGGFAFAEDGGGAPHWAGYPPALLTVPEVALARHGDDVRLTFAVAAQPDDVPDQLPARLERRARAPAPPPPPPP